MESMKLRALILSLLVAGLIATATLIKAKLGSEPGLQISRQDALPRVEAGEQAAEMPTERPLELYSEFHKLWTTTPTRKPRSPATLLTEEKSQNGLLLVGTSDGTLDAYDLFSGKLLWRVKKKHPIFAPPAVWGFDRVFAGEGAHDDSKAAFTAVELHTGAPLWQLETKSHIVTGPSSSGEASSKSLDVEDALFLGAGRLGVLALSPLTGRVLWRQPVGHVDSTPLFRQSSGKAELWVLAQPEDKIAQSRLLLLDPSSGDWKGSTEVAGAPSGSPLASQGSIFFTTRGERGWLHKVDAACPEDGNCRLRWTKPIEGDALPRVASLPGAGLIFITLKTGKILAYRTEDGAIAWSYDLGARTEAEASLTSAIRLDEKGRNTGSLLAAIGSDGKAVLVDPYSGQVLKTLQSGVGASTAPVFADDRLFLVTPREISAYGGLSKLAIRHPATP